MDEVSEPERRLPVKEDSGWLRSDEFQDVIASLEALGWATENLDHGQHFWKIAVLSAHAALQGACVCILTQTDGTGALSNKCEEAMSNKLYGESDGQRHFDNPTVAWPEPRLADLAELISRLPKSLNIHMTKRSAKKWPTNRDGDLRRLHEFRNQFTHFPSISWSIELDGLPRIILHALDVTEAIASSELYSRSNRFDKLLWRPPLERARKMLREHSAQRTKA